MLHSSLLLPCHVRELPGDAIELMPIVLPMTLTSSQRRQLAEILLAGLDEPDASPAVLPTRRGHFVHVAT
ncbi:hypothetical protein ACIBO2_37125 [Nonomuraea sp. NPDC050022]|uniref:hypothetical protein n=1 Tax=unclassified Nonomuraea TaxID=2593643 RepID=UPI0033F2DDF9